MSLRRALGASLLAGLLAAGCGALAPTPGPLAHLRTLPEASLAPPGAVLIGSSAQEEHMTFDGVQPAVYTRAFGTQEPATAVELFYADRLPFAGWTAAQYPSTPDIASWAGTWYKGSYELTMYVVRRGTDDPRLPSASLQATYPTIFKVVLSEGGPTASSSP